MLKSKNLKLRNTSWDRRKSVGRHIKVLKSRKIDNSSRNLSENVRSKAKNLESGQFADIIRNTADLITIQIHFSDMSKFTNAVRE